jgi:protein translocase subunit secA
MRTEAIEEERFFDLERRIVLDSIDELWMRHIDSMSKLKDAVAFEGYAQRNPLVVYKEKAFEKFDELINEIEFKVVKSIFSVRKIEAPVEQEIQISENQLEEMMKNFQEQLEKQKLENNDSENKNKIRV